MTTHNLEKQIGSIDCRVKVTLLMSFCWQSKQQMGKNLFSVCSYLESM